MLRRVLLANLIFSFTVSAEDRLVEYYHRAVPRAEQFVQQIPQNNFAVYTLFDNIGILTSANVKPESVSRLLRIAEEIQDTNPDSPTFGNFWWYRNDARVTDPNAAEFALARMLSIYLDTPDSLSEEDRSMLTRMFERSVHVCLSRRIRPDYTNIALYNAIHLILLGQVLDRPAIAHEGTLRLHHIVFSMWNHGIFEYNSPDYCYVNVDALQLGLRHVSDASTKQIIQTLLELFWTDMSLHWYKPSVRLAGAQSRSSHFLYGTSVQTTRLFSFVDLAPYDHGARYHGVLNSFRALYQPPPEIVNLNSQYPRCITRNWGHDSAQWATLCVFDDIALGTAGTHYEGMQNMVQTVDIANNHLAGTPAPRVPPKCYFIADGRENPYGTERSPTGRGGQQKSLHLDALWFGAQRTVDSLGIALYPPKAIEGNDVVNVQSHFVIRKPESTRSHRGANATPLLRDEPMIFRYETCAIGIRVIWTRHQNGQPAEIFLVDDGNDHDVYRLTVEHGKTADGRRQTAVLTEPQSLDCGETTQYPGVAFWIRIGSNLDSDEQFSSWQEQFLFAPVHHLEVKQNDIDIAVAGQDGIVSISRTDARITTEPAAPLGILTLDGKDLGRSILEKIPAVATFSKRRDEAKPIVVNPAGTHWQAATGYSFFEGVVEPDGVAARINHALSWQLQVEQPGEYYLWGRVQTRDPQHDSFWVEAAERLPDNSYMHRSVNVDWHLGTRETWTWVRLPSPIRLEKGIWQLTLKPREYEGRIDQLFLTSDVGGKPEMP